MAYVKYAVVTVFISLSLGFLLVYMQQNKDYETIIEVKDETTNDYIEVAEISLFPNLKQKFSTDLSGKGRVIFGTELYTVAFITVTSEGYETKRSLKFLNAQKDNVLYLKPIENMVSKDGEEDSVKDNKKPKVDLLPQIVKPKESEK